MAGSFRIAEGYVEVTADESGYETAMTRLKGRKHSVKVGVALGDADAIAKLDKLVKDRVVKITANADTRVAADELRNLVQRRSTLINATADTRLIAVELDELTRDRTVNIGVTLDETVLEKLAELPSTIDISVTLNQASYERVEKALDKLAKERSVTIRPNVETRVAADELRNLTQKRKVRLGVDLDTRVAADELAVFLLPRSLTVKVNLDTVELDRLTGLTRDVDIKPLINDAAYDRVVAKLDKLTADRNIIIRPSVDTRVAADELRNLTRRQRVRIGVDVDTRVAADDIANLTRRRTLRVTADADVAAARTRIDALTRNRTVNVRADVDRSAASRLASMFGGGLSGAFGAIKGGLTSIAGLALQALPALASVGSAVMQMGPAAAVAVPAVLSLGAAFAAIKIGTSGIGDAFKAAFAPATASAGAATKSTHQLENAQRSLAKAQQGVKDAEVRAAEARVQAARQIADAQQNLKNTVQDVADATRRAAESVASAERDLADAQRSARQAQQDLTAARKDAAEELEDLNARLTDAQLDQRQKVLDLQDAEQELAAVKAKGAKATQEEIDKAQLQYDRAVQGLAEQQTETARLQEQAEEANRAGVEGSKTVVDAKGKISDANQDVADKTKALADAEAEAARTAEDNAQRIAKAERDVADARENARKAAVDGARQIADAQDAVADAARAMADSQTAGAVAVDKVGQAMAKLAPNARAFVNAVIAQREAWRGLKLDVQNALFAGLGETFTRLSGIVLPSLKAGLVGTATVMNSMAKNVAIAVAEMANTGELSALFDGLNKGLKPLSRVPAEFILGLSRISIAASPIFQRLTKAAGAAADKVSVSLGEAFRSGDLAASINHGVEVAIQFGHLIGDIFGTLGNVMKAAGAAGGDALGGLGAAFAELRRITAMPEVQKALTSIFTAVNAIAKLFATTLGAVLQAVLPLLAALAPVITELATKFGPVLAQLAEALGKALMPIIEALLPVVSDIGGILVGLVQAVLPLLQPLGELIGAIVTAFAPIIRLIGENLKTFITALVQFLAPVMTALVPVVQMFGQLFAQLAPVFAQIYPALLPLIPPLAQLTVALLNLAMQVLTPLMPLITGLAQLLAGVLAGAIGILVPVITTVIGWITTFVDAMSAGVKLIADVFQWLFDFLVGHSIVPDLVNLIVYWFTSLWANTKKIFTDLKNGVVAIWNSLWGAVKEKWNTFWSGLKSAFTGAWKSFRDSVTGLKTSITNTWNSLWNGARDKMSSIFSTINSKITSFKNGMKAAFTNLRDGLGTIWNGIKSKIGSPVKFVVDTVYNHGIRTMWNSIAGKISSKITLPSIKLGFNKGGVVPGSGNSDTVPAMLTPGERILSNQQVAELGGHRGIDAMLGRDKPTRTGGNPSSQQEKQRQQATPHFASGGIVGKVTSGIGGAIGGALDWTKDLVIGGLKAAAQKALNSLVRPLINQIPGSGIGNLMRGLANKGVDGMMGWFGKEDKKAVGGPAVQRALSWVKTQNGLPYQWAGNGNPSWDCSGLMSAIESVIRGQSPHRRWATGSFSGSSGPSGWVRNLNSPFMIGITNAGVGHTAGTLAGLNVESSGGRGVHMGSTARGYKDSLFTSRWGFAPAAKYDSGGLLQPGATMAINKTRKPEAVLTAEEHEAFRSLVTGLSNTGLGDGVTVNVAVEVRSMTIPTNAEAQRFAKAIVEPVKEELRKLENSRRR